MKNPILDELHEVRRKLLEESGGTLAGLVARLQAEEKTSGHKVLTPEELESLKAGSLASANESS